MERNGTNGELEEKHHYEGDWKIRRTRRRRRRRRSREAGRGSYSNYSSSKEFPAACYYPSAPSKRQPHTHTHTHEHTMALA